MATNPTNMVRESQPRPIVLPLLLIAVGVALLLVNLGYLSWETVRSAWQYWPVVLILLGLETLITRRIPWGILILAVVLTFFLGSGNPMRFGPWNGPQPHRPGFTRGPSAVQSQDLAGASRAVVNLSAGGAHLGVSSLAEPGMLARWQVQESTEASVSPSFQVRDGVGRLELTMHGGRRLPAFWRKDRGEESGGDGRIDVQLASGIPLEIEGHLGASDASVSLTHLNVTKLSLDVGASNTTIEMPANAASTLASVRGGASNLVIVVPEGVNARISSEGGFSSVRVNQDRFTRGQGGGGSDEYRSSEAAPGANQLDLTLRLGAANVEIR